MNTFKKERRIWNQAVDLVSMNAEYVGNNMKENGIMTSFRKNLVTLTLVTAFCAKEENHEEEKDKLIIMENFVSSTVNRNSASVECKHVTLTFETSLKMDRLGSNQTDHFTTAMGLFAKKSAST